jgi:hypothetical protein
LILRQSQQELAGRPAAQSNQKSGRPPAEKRGGR